MQLTVSPVLSHPGEPAGLSGVAFVSFAGMESILDERFLEDPWGSGDNSGRKLKMNSRVVGGLTTGEKKEGFSEPIVYTLENIQVWEGGSTGTPIHPPILTSLSGIRGLRFIDEGFYSEITVDSVVGCNTEIPNVAAARFPEW